MAERHLAALDQPLTGWFAHAAPFAFADDFARADGIRAMLCSTPQMLSMVAFEAALDAFDGIAMRDVQAKGRALGDLMIALADERLAPLGVGIAGSRDGARRGNHVSLTHPEGYRIMQALIARGVIGDFRAPDVMRFGFGPLYVRYVDVFDAVVGAGRDFEERRLEGCAVAEGRNRNVSSGGDPAGRRNKRAPAAVLGVEQYHWERSAMELAKGFLKSIFEREDQTSLSRRDALAGLGLVGVLLAAPKLLASTSAEAKALDKAAEASPAPEAKPGKPGCRSGLRRCERGRRDRPECAPLLAPPLLPAVLASPILRAPALLPAVLAPPLLAPPLLAPPLLVLRSRPRFR